MFDNIKTWLGLDMPIESPFQALEIKSELIGKTFEVWLNLVNNPKKIPRIVTVLNVEAGMLYIKKAKDTPDVEEPKDFEGWIHPMNILALTPYAEVAK